MKTNGDQESMINDWKVLKKKFTSDSDEVQVTVEIKNRM